MILETVKGNPGAIGGAVMGLVGIIGANIGIIISWKSGGETRMDGLRGAERGQEDFHIPLQS